jgi:uncharacterized Zn-finger protein
MLMLFRPMTWENNNKNDNNNDNCYRVRGKQSGQLPSKIGKSFMCSECAKLFSTSHHLIEHTRTHTGEKPYGCSICNSSGSYAQAFALKSHVRTTTGDRPYQCKQCPNSFTVPGALLEHLKRHAGIKSHSCSMCAKLFTTALSSSLGRATLAVHSVENHFQSYLIWKSI